MVYQFPKMLSPQHYDRGRNMYMENIQIPRFKSPPIYLYGSGDQPGHAHTNSYNNIVSSYLT